LDMAIDSEEEDLDDHQDHNPFASVTQDGDQFYDEDNEQIMFTAGLDELRSEMENSRKKIWDAIDALNYYDHEILARTSLTAAEMFGERDEDDPTLTRVVAEMQALSESLQCFPAYLIWSLVRFGGLNSGFQD